MDMAGNVCEWTSSERKTGSGFMVAHGGAFSNTARGVCCAARDKGYPSSCYQHVGFRLVASRASG
jgi:formylglycine-generating enzyme required for sulfatase activity